MHPPHIPQRMENNCIGMLCVLYDHICMKCSRCCRHARWTDRQTVSVFFFHIQSVQEVVLLFSYWLNVMVVNDQSHVISFQCNWTCWSLIWSNLHCYGWNYLNVNNSRFYNDCYCFKLCAWMQTIAKMHESNFTSAFCILSNSSTLTSPI